MVKDGANFELPAPEWVQMQDPEAPDERFSLFYYNVKTAACVWREPDWDEIWSKRRSVSELVESMPGWEKLYDPNNDLEFYFNLREGVYQWEDPFQEYY